MMLIIRLFIGTAVLSGAAACGGTSMFGKGEAFGISFVNFGETNLTKVRIDGVGNDNFLYDAHDRVPPFRGKPPTFANISTFQDNNRKIPEKVSVTWMGPAKENPSEDQSIAHGPFLVDVRGRIPEAVLKLSKKRRFGIGIDLVINNGPITINWGLRASGDRGVESRYLCVGGDYFTATGETTFRPFGLPEEAKSIGVWPNCRLP
jgi:hypothetical protein